MGEIQKITDLAKYYNFVLSEPFKPEYFKSLMYNPNTGLTRFLTKGELIFLDFASRQCDLWNKLYSQVFIEAFCRLNSPYTNYTDIRSTSLLQELTNGVGSETLVTFSGTKVVTTQDLVIRSTGGVILMIGGEPFTESLNPTFGYYNPFTDTFLHVDFTDTNVMGFFDYYPNIRNSSPFFDADSIIPDS